MANSDHPDGKLKRRDVLKLGTAAAAGFVARGVMAETPQKMPVLPVNPVTPDAMPTRNLGKTGYQVGIFSLGGQAAIEEANNFDVAVPLIEEALNLGVNYADTSARYGGVEDRWSEQYFGEALKNRRTEVFLATKTHDRTRDGSMKLLERSLELLKTDHIDLWQMHNLARMEQVEQVFAPGGAIEALVEAREQGIVRSLGISGHADPDVLIAAIERFDFDTVLLALNAADPYHLSFKEKLLPMAVEKEMGIIGMKIPARGLIFQVRQNRARDARHARSDALRVVAAGEYGDRRLRHHLSARREHRDRALLYAVERRADGRARRTGQANPRTGFVFPPPPCIGVSDARHNPHRRSRGSDVDNADRRGRRRCGDGLCDDGEICRPGPRVRPSGVPEQDRARALVR
jgi:aryl-alcohol dehydrogenase-like predicted oxidoreductase